MAINYDRTKRKRFTDVFSRSCCWNVGGVFTGRFVPVRVFVASHDSVKSILWAETLRSLDHYPLTLGGEFDTPFGWFAKLRSVISLSQVMVIDSEDYRDCELSEYLSFIVGFAEAMGVQVIEVGSTPHSIVQLNPRNVQYNDFSDACDFYFSTGKAMKGQRAV